MADQMINGLPVKTAPQTGDKLLVIGAAEEELIDYDKLADAILNKLTSKSFTLDQGNMSLVAALNALNSKTFGMYCEYISVKENKGICFKLQNSYWNKRSALIIGCDNTQEAIHEVIAAHYDSVKKEVIVRTSGTKEWTVNQDSRTISANFRTSSEILVIHTGFEEVKAFN